MQIAGNNATLLYEIIIRLYRLFAMKVLALDLGDVHVGVAICDDSRTIATPLTTLQAHLLLQQLNQLIVQYSIGTVVVGLPTTLQGKESAQTRKVLETYKQLQEAFPHTTFVQWDERLTSKQAAIIKPGKNKQDKSKQHAIAAAIVLQAYLEYLRFQQERHE